MRSPYPPYVPHADGTPMPDDEWFAMLAKWVREDPSAKPPVRKTVQPSKLRQQTIRDLVGLTALVSIFAAVQILWPAPSHAEPITNADIHDAALFCSWLNTNSTDVGMRAAVDEFRTQGVSVETTTTVIAYALTTICPEYLTAFNALVYRDTEPTLRRAI